LGRQSVIVLDTHIWLWALTEPARLSEAQHEAIFGPARSAGIGLSVISCWEVATALARGRIVLPVSLDDWMRDATRVEHLQSTCTSFR
jgi:PIN domain nuclease of toxin-antitoxin system